MLGDLATYGVLKPGLTHGQAFFRSFRDLTATGFWTTKMGFDDLGYKGNTVVAEVGRLSAGAAQEAGTCEEMLKSD